MTRIQAQNKLGFQGLAPHAMADITKVREYTNLDTFQQFGARMTKQLLMMAEAMGHINPERVKTVCDFGAGSGGPTFALKHHFRLPEGNLTALEMSETAAKDIVKSEILPESQVLAGDGLAHLRSGKKKYDLITANMLGPDDKDGTLFLNLIDAAKNSLSPEGKLLVYSEANTMGTVQRLCESEGLNYRWIQGVNAEPPVPSTAIISLDKSAPAALGHGYSDMPRVYGCSKTLNGYGLDPNKKPLYPKLNFKVKN